MKTVLLMLIILLSGCTEAQRAVYESAGSSAHVTCYSGGKLIYEDDSTSAITNEEYSDGFVFRERSDDKIVEISGQCLFKYK